MYIRVDSVGKGTEDVISIDPTFIAGHVRYTTVSFKPM